MLMFPPRRGLRLLVCLLVPLLLAACAGAPTRTLQPVKSPNDSYDYRLLTLENELQVLLISAPEAPKAAASLVVMVGSGDNPPGRAGLAHFLEHMLFLGTDKYPDAAEYERYITEHGGTRNAYTSFDHTNYFFDVNPQHLPEALDRFAQFFIAPRFDAQYVDREMKAVEAEYQMGLKSDGRRGLDVLQEVMNPEHPYSQFSVGSLETLGDRDGDPVREDLLDFYARHYSANVMRLVVLGPGSLDELEDLVVPIFSAVPNQSFEHEEIEAPLFAPGSLPMFVQVEPLATQRELDVSFPIPDYRDDYRVKPVAYLGGLIGHEGEGSLLSQLKAEGLAQSLGAGAGLAWRGGSLFSINVALTEKGAAERERVLELLFAYMEMLRETGPRDWLYGEQARLSELDFRFREPGNPVSYAYSLAAGMHYYAPEDVLRGPYIMEDYDAAMIAGLMDYIRPENAIVMFSDQSVSTDAVTEYYGVPYARDALPAAELQVAADDPARGTLHLPAPNEFIADDLALIDPPDPPPEKPAVAREGPRQKIWFMPDTEFRVPKGAVYVRFRSAEAGQDARQAALLALYASVMSDSVNELLYPAHLAGLDVGFYRQSRGITLQVDGYNDKQLLLLEDLLDVVAAPDFDPQRFDDIRNDMIRALRNAAAKPPSSQVMEDLEEAVRFSAWGEEALIAELKAASPDGLEDYMERFWATAQAEALVFGNYDPDAVQRLSVLLRTLIGADAAPEVPAQRVLQLGSGESLRYAVDIPHDDAVIAWYLQGAADSWHDRAATALTAQIIKSGFFQQLRTEQQLGYVVAAFNWTQLDVPGLVMLIQSPVADAAHVTAAMETFMQGVIPDLDEDQFRRHRAALVTEVLRPDKNLREKAEYYWRSIKRGHWDFADRQALAAAVESLSLEDWQAYYRDVFLDRRHSLQVVSPGRFDAMPGTPAREFGTAEALKQGHAAYAID